MRENRHDNHPANANQYLIILFTHPMMMLGTGAAPCARSVGQAFGQAIQLVAAVEAQGEAGKVALSVLGADVM